MESVRNLRPEVTDSDYCALTVACDDLLRAATTTPERVAVPWLHVLSEHPSNLPQYEVVFRSPSFTGRAKKRIQHSATFSRTLARSLLKPGADRWVAALQLPAKVDVLLISHHLSPTPDTDFYYGALPRELVSRGATTLVLLLNHGVTRNASGLMDLPGGRASRLVMPLALGLGDEIDIARRARSAQSGLFDDAATAPTAFERDVAAEAARHAMTGTAISSLRVHNVVKRLCAKLRPRAVLVTWEGHAWERLAFHAARSVVPNVRCIGYQHTIIFPRSHALCRSIGSGYDPDIIVTAGDVNRDVLRRAEGLAGIPIVTYGSHRRAAALKPRAADASTRCLVIPEGLEGEYLVLFDFAVRAAARLPDIEFVLRAHPVLPFRQLAQRHPRFRHLPPNVRVSVVADISDDFAQCDWALYRGSSAVVHAVLAGVRPVYVEREDELNFDPLFAMEGWRRHVATADALRCLVRTDQALCAEQIQMESAPAREFCERYVVTADPDVIWKLLAPLIDYEPAEVRTLEDYPKVHGG